MRILHPWGKLLGRSRPRVQGVTETREGEGAPEGGAVL